jgi:hypothetical protein
VASEDPRRLRMVIGCGGSGEAAGVN